MMSMCYEESCDTSKLDTILYDMEVWEETTFHEMGKRDLMVDEYGIYYK